MKKALFLLVIAGVLGGSVFAVDFYHLEIYDRMKVAPSEVFNFNLGDETGKAVVWFHSTNGWVLLLYKSNSETSSSVKPANAVTVYSVVSSNLNTIRLSLNNIVYNKLILKNYPDLAADLKKKFKL
jgi:hypothetical protein